MLLGSDILPRKNCLFVRHFARVFTSALPSATAIWKIPLLTRTLILSLAFLLMGGLLRPEEAYAADCNTTQIYSAAVDAATCEVPAGYDTVTIKAWGAGGGGGGEADGGVGGGGGFAQGDITVTPGESLTIRVGGGGSIASDGGAGGGGNAVTAAGGGAGGTESDSEAGEGGSGGGYAAVLSGSTYLIQAGGGGGGGGQGKPGKTGGAGGSGGGSSGLPGASANGGGGGAGDTLDGGGLGSGGSGGLAGTANTGGNGSEQQGNGNGAGGGGGGGRYGGGGGGASTIEEGGGGGGGGSSLVTGTNTNEQQGSGQTAANTGDDDYAGNAGQGGAATGGDGNPGRIVLIFSASASGALTGNIIGDSSADIVSGSSTIILTLTNDTWVAASGGLTVETFNSSGTWTVPAGVTSVKVEAWGSGGAGSGGGYGGGAYAATDNIVVTPGANIPYVVGAGGVCCGGDPGANSTFNSTVVVADGAPGTGGGTTAGSTGDTKFAGGGGVGGNGGGGGAAGPDGAGSSGSGSTGGSGDAGTGGAGGTAGNPGAANSEGGGGGGGTGTPAGAGGAPGGGGGGGGGGQGGAGGVGQIRLTYTPAPFDAERQNIIDGLTSAQSETNGWNNEVRNKQSVGGVVRTSDTVVTITLDAQASYAITANETIEAKIPATALVTSGSEVTATPTFDITSNGPPNTPTLSETPAFSNIDTSDTTPVLGDFSATDPESDAIEYDIQWDEDYNFGTPVTQNSANFAGNGFTAATFASGASVSYTVQAGEALTNGQTYWWRVRARDPSGANTWSSYSAPRSITIDTSITLDQGFQTTTEQFDSANGNTLTDTQATGNGVKLNGW